MILMNKTNLNQKGEKEQNIKLNILHIIFILKHIIIIHYNNKRTIFLFKIINIIRKFEYFLNFIILFSLIRDYNRVIISLYLKSKNIIIKVIIVQILIQ